MLLIVSAFFPPYMFYVFITKKHKYTEKKKIKYYLSSFAREVVKILSNKRERDQSFDKQTERQRRLESVAK